MSRNDDIQEFFVAEWRNIRDNEVIPFAVYLYFPLNTHIIQLIPAEEMVTEQTHERYAQRGVKEVYIANKDREAYLAYLNPPVEEQKTIEEELKQAAPEDSSADPVAEERQEESPQIPHEEKIPSAGELVAEVLKSEKNTQEQKEAIAHEIGKEMLEDLASAENLEEQQLMDEKARKMVNDIISSVNDQAKSVMQEVMQLANLDPELEHAVNVSSYAVIFAMTFGRIDTQLLADLALAGLLHDLGLSQIPADVTILPFQEMSDEQRAVYAEHVTQSASLIRRYASDTPERVSHLISQHHEKFDGTGYPAHLEGFDFDDIAQILGLAEILDAMMNGAWDGEKRTFSEALSQLDSLEKARSFPEYFDPDIFSQVIQYIQGEKLEESMDQASQVVQDQIGRVVSQSEGDAA